MNTTVITIKIDKQTKSQAQKVAEDLGFSLSSLIKAQLKHLIRSKRVDIGMREEIPNAYFKKAIEEARTDRKAGKASPMFKSAKESIAWLEKQAI